MKDNKFEQVRVDLSIGCSILMSNLDIIGNNNAEIRHDICLLGDFSVMSNSRVCSVFTLYGNIFLGKYSSSHSLQAGGIVIVENGCHTWDISAVEAIVLNDNSITGELTSGSDIYIGQNARVEGDVTAWGKVYLHESAIIFGTITSHCDSVITLKPSKDSKSPLNLFPI